MQPLKNPRAKKPFDREIILVFGQTGSGKTQWTKRFIRGLPRVIIVDPLDEYDGLLAESTEALIDAIENRKVFTVRTLLLEDFPFICQVARVAGPCTLVVEETQRILPPRVDVPESFSDLIYRGRHYGVSVVMVSQRPMTVNLVARSQWTQLITFRQVETSDVRWIQQVTGSVADLNLPILSYFHFTLHGVEQKKIVLTSQKL